MTLSADQLVERLIKVAPESAGVIAEHREDHGALLLHLLMADLLRYSVAAFERGDRDLSDRCLAVVADGLLDGDVYMQNAVLVSFIEDVGLAPGETAEFIASWPRVLLHEVKRREG